MLTLTRRDDKVITFTFYDENGDAINLTGCALYTTVKQSRDDTDANAKIASTLTIATPATSGVATWTIVPADTQYLKGLYFWDVQLKDSSSKISTIINDMIEVVEDVTIRTTV